MILTFILDQRSCAMNIFKNLKNIYQVRDFGVAHYMLGFAMYQEPKTVSIHLAQPHLGQLYLNILRMCDRSTRDVPKQGERWRGFIYGGRHLYLF